MAPPKTSVDDYYAHIEQRERDASDQKQKRTTRVKIKKKVVESTLEKPVEDTPDTPESISTSEKWTRANAGRPITFESAPPRTEPVSDVSEKTGPSSAPVSEKSHEEKSVAAKQRRGRSYTRPTVTFEPSGPRDIPKKSESPRTPERRRASETPASASAKQQTTTESERKKADAFHKPKQESRLKTYERKKSERRHSEDADGARHRRGWIRTHGAVDDRGDDDRGFRRTKKAHAQPKKEKKVEEIQQVLVDRTGQEVAIPEVLTVKELSEKFGVPMGKIIAELLKNGMVVNLNTRIDFDTSYLVGESFGIVVKRVEQAGVSSLDILEGDISELLREDDESTLTQRPPVISIMGHVDHGKTSILDFIRSTAVAEGEEGGITQRIGAYQVEKDGRKITFLDTPGHEAFGLMRSRGSKLTDIIVLVVAADEGAKPQTIESIELAKAAEVPVVVAINKMDKEGANPELVKWQLAEHDLTPEEWGGSTVMVPVSAKTGLGMETLLDMILLVSDMQELQANSDRAGVATVIEARLDPRLGHVATILINTGKIHKSEAIVSGEAYGRIRSLRDFRGKNIESAGPSTPAIITGLNAAVEGGDILQVVPDLPVAEKKAHEFKMLKATRSIHTFEGASLDAMLWKLKSGNLKQLKIVLKADSNGSLEALRGALLNLSTAETQVHIIHTGVGDVNDNDVYMAGMGQALLIAYNVSVNPQARQTLEDSKIEFINKRVIYHILEKIEAIITGMIDIRYDDVDIGVAAVKAIFYRSKDRLIIGLAVESGKIELRAKARIIRDERKVGDGEITSLKIGPTDVREVASPDECGINLKTDVRIQEGDTLEVYARVERK